MFMLLSILFPILAGLALIVFGCDSRREREIYVIAVAVMTAGLAFVAVFAAPHEIFPVIKLNETLSFALRVDGLGSVFSVMVAVLWVLASFYALEYMKHEGQETRFFSFFLMSFGVTLGVAFSANILTMYLFYELLTLATLPLVMHNMDDKARYAGKKYILYSMTGAALAFCAMVYVLGNSASPDFSMGGSLLVSATQNQNTMLLLFVIGFFGFGVKAAVFPFHGWLISAAVAPTPVTALLHAVAVVKSGVFAVIRLTYFCFGAQVLIGTWAQGVMIAAVTFTILFASANALRTPHTKRRLAYSTVSNLSYILLGVSMMSTAGLVAGVVHMLAHAVMKSTLFFCAGAVFYRTRKEYTYETVGYGRVMPVIMFCFTVTGLSLMGVPPLAGFISKWRIGTAAVASGLPLGYIGACVLIISSLLAAFYIMTIILPAYFPGLKGGRLETVVENRDPNWLMKGPLLILTAISVMLVVWAQPLLTLLAELLR